MTKIDVELHEDVISILNKLKNVDDSSFELIVPEGAVLFENILNLKLLRTWSDKEEKIVNFKTDDVNGQNLILSIEEGEKNLDDFGDESAFENKETALPQEVEVTKKRPTLPKVKLGFPKISFPGFKKGLIFFVILFLILGIGGFFGLKYLATLPIASVKIVVNSQPLTRSLQVKVKNGAVTNVDTKLVKGSTLQALVDDQISGQTTGSKTIGEKASGSVILYNKTTKEREFKKGSSVFYTGGQTDMEYLLQEAIKVPARSDSTTPSKAIIPGVSKDVKVIAFDIGKKFNIDKGESLEVEGQKTSDFEAEVSKDISGGTEQKVAVVTQKDIDDLKAKLLENSQEKALRALQSSVTGGMKLINGTTAVTVTKEALSNKVDDQVKELTLSQTFAAKGLQYDPKELDGLIDKVVIGFIPQGYVLSTKERTVNVEVLGNTDSTVASSEEADLQVTLKTFVITDVSENKIKTDLKGKTVADAQKYVGSLKNIKTYEIKLNPRIPFLDKIPTDESRINIEIERQ